jgi:hypothetical protein
MLPCYHGTPASTHRLRQHGRVPIPYEYDARGDQVTIRTQLAGGATYRGSFSADGNSGSGGWRLDPGKEGPGNVAYDITTTRAS